MSDSDNGYETDGYESNQDDWKSIPHCVGTNYHPDPRLKDWIIEAAPDETSLEPLNHRLFVCEPPKKKYRKRKIMQEEIENEAKKAIPSSAMHSPPVTTMSPSPSVLSNNIQITITPTKLPLRLDVAPVHKKQKIQIKDQLKQIVRYHIDSSNENSPVVPAPKSPLPTETSSFSFQASSTVTTTVSQQKSSKVQRTKSPIPSVSEKPRRVIPSSQAVLGSHTQQSPALSTSKVPGETMPLQIASASQTRPLPVSAAPEKPRRVIPLQPLPSSTSITSERQRRTLPQSSKAYGKLKESISDIIRDAKRMYDNLSEEQKKVHDCAVVEKKNVFFTGSAGNIL
jgi:hypothetical protein